MRPARIVLIAVFLSALWLPIVQMKFELFREYKNMENRELAEPPKLTRHGFHRLPRDCETYLADHFGLRTNLIRWNSILKVGFLGVSPIQSVIVGKDSWLFYRSEALSDGETVNDYRGTIPLDEDELLKLRSRLEQNRERFSRNGIIYLVAIAPNKNTIYSEYMPDVIRKHRPFTRLDQFMEHMKKNSSVSIIDLREALLRAKADFPVYWKTDSHWNTYGAFVGYKEILNRLSLHFPSLNSLSIAEDRVSVETLQMGGDLAQMLFMQDLLPEENDTRFKLSNSPEVPPLKRIIFRHDSFGDNLYPYLKPHFEKIINIAPFTPYRFDWIAQQQPQVVLHVFAERYVTQAVHDDFYYKETGDRIQDTEYRR